ncbi:MAG: hypothetical protein RL885_24705 [Planctomycetota bacterium]
MQRQGLHWVEVVPRAAAESLSGAFGSARELPPVQRLLCAGDDPTHGLAWLRLRALHVLLGGELRRKSRSRLGLRLIEELASAAPSAALYFQDSIFPGGHRIREGLLPLLRRLGREWGCQVYLPMLTERRVAELADHGCTYLYTGIESGASTVLDGIRKPGLDRQLVLERAGWVVDRGLAIGLSLMFGAMTTEGELLETSSTLAETRDLATAILDTGVDVAGFYPNVQTVLPGTPLAKGLQRSGAPLDFYRMPRAPIFRGLEDGEIGYNFLSLRPISSNRQRLARQITETAGLQATF